MHCIHSVGHTWLSSFEHNPYAREFDISEPFGTLPGGIFNEKNAGVECEPLSSEVRMVRRGGLGTPAK